MEASRKERISREMATYNPIASKDQAIILLLIYYISIKKIDDDVVRPIRGISFYPLVLQMLSQDQKQGIILGIKAIK